MSACRPSAGSIRRTWPARSRRIEDWLDEGLGPDGRLWMYHQSLPVRRAMRPWIVAGVPRIERGAFTVVGWALDPFIRRYLGVDEAASRLRFRVSTACSTRSPRCSPTAGRS